MLGYDEHVLNFCSAVSNSEGSTVVATTPLDASSIIAFNVPVAGQVFVYDHGEDGYEDDLASPVQSTTEIWGDGDTSNGFPPGFATDVLSANDVISLESRSGATACDPGDGNGNRCQLVDINSRSTALRWDGQDVVFTLGQPISVVHVMFPGNTTSDTIIGGTWEVFPKEVFEETLTYAIPVGTDTHDNNGGDNGFFENFKYVAHTVQATEDDTDVIVDNGVTTVSFTLAKGESWWSGVTDFSNRASFLSTAAINTTLRSDLNIDTLANTTVTASRPVQVGYLTGGDGTLQTRFYNVIPTGVYASEYLSPVYTTNGQEADIFINNPNTFDITVTAQDSGGTRTINVPAQGAASYSEAGPGAEDYVPVNSSVRFSSDSLFWGIGAYDTGSVGGTGTPGDWGWTLQAAGFLNRKIVCSHGPGNRSQVSTLTGGGNGSPVWVAPLEDGTVFTVDFTGDGTPDGVDTDNDGDSDGTSFTVDALEVLAIYEPTAANGGTAPINQTGAIINATGDFTAAWGFRNSNASQDPGDVDNLDWGYSINPFDIRFQEPLLDVQKSATPKSINSQSTITYTVCVSTDALTPVTDVVLHDDLPAGFTYTTGTATITYPDGSTVDLDPVQSGQRLTWDLSESLGPKETLCVEFDALSTDVVICQNSGTAASHDFATADYSAGTGWDTNWTETNDTGTAQSPTAGQVQIQTGTSGCLSGYLEMLRADNSGPVRIQRQLDTRTVCVPELVITRSTGGLTGAGEGFDLEVSNDGSTFTTIRSWTNALAQCTTENIDISQYAGETLHVRLSGRAANSSSADLLRVNSISVQGAGDRPSDITDDFELTAGGTNNPGSWALGSGWLSDWVEAGDDGSATAGGLSIRTSAGSGACQDDVHLATAVGTSSSGDTLTRQVDLSGFNSPQISFSSTHNFNQGNDTADFETSTNGTTFTSLHEFRNNNEPTGCETHTFSLGTDVTHIRFSTSGLESGDTLRVDDITITDTSATPQANASIANTGVATGVYRDLPLEGDDTELVYVSNLRLSMAVSTVETEVGEIITYTVTYENIGSSTLTNVSIGSPVPPFVEHVPNSLSGSPSPSTTSFDSGAKEVGWSVGNLSAGSTGTVEYTVLVNQVPEDETRVTADAVGIIDGTRAVRSNEVQTLIRIPILRIFKEAPGSVPNGGDVPFTFTLRNDSVARATNTTMTDRVPAFTAFVMNSAETSRGTISYSNSGKTDSDFTYTPADGNDGSTDGVDATVTYLRWEYGTLSGPDTVTSTWVARETTGAANDIIRNVALVTSDQTTIRSSNFTRTVITDLGLQVSVKDVLCAQEKFTISLAASNFSTTSAFTSLVVTMPVPDYTSYRAGSVTTPSGFSTSWSIDGGTTFSSTEPVPPFATDVTHLQFTSASLSASTTATGSFDVILDEFPPTIELIEIGGTIDSAETAVLNSNQLRRPWVNLRVTKTASKLAAAQGESILWRMTVRNVGTAVAEDTFLIDPGGGVADIFDLTDLDTGTVTPSGSVGPGNASVSWTLGDVFPLAASQVFTFESDVRSDATTGDVIDNIAKASCPACDGFSDVVQVIVAGPGLASGPSKVGYGDQGDVLYYGASITNTGSVTDTVEILLDTQDGSSPWDSGAKVFLDADGDGEYDPSIDTELTAGGVGVDYVTSSITPGNRIFILVQVTIPGGAADGTQNVTEVTTRLSSDNSLTSVFTETTNINSSTAVRLADLRATQAAGGVSVTWATLSESNNVGFRIERSASREGPWHATHASLIPGVGNFVGRREYQHLDAHAPGVGPLYYRLFDVDYLGHERGHGPVGVDRDGDGVPFDLEERWGLSDSDPGDVLVDHDGDGTASGDEILGGRDPFTADAPDATPVAGQAVDLTLPPQGVRFHPQPDGGLEVELVLWDYALTSRLVEGQPAQYPRLDEVVAGVVETPGLPALPVVGTMLPEGFAGATLVSSSVEVRNDVEVGPAPRASEDANLSNLLPTYLRDPEFYGQPPALFLADAFRFEAGEDGGPDRLVFQPFGYDHAGRRLVFRPRIRVRLAPSTVASSQLGLSLPAGGGLAAIPAGPLFRLRTTGAGLHRLTGQDLIDLGADPAGHDPRNLSLWKNGVQVPCRITDGAGGDGQADGTFHATDVLEFYQDDEGDRFAGGGAVHLLYGSAAGQRWAPTTLNGGAPGSTPARTSYRHTERVELRDFYFGTLVGDPEQDRFVAGFGKHPSVGNFFGPSLVEFDVPVSNPSASGFGAIARVTYGATTDAPGAPDHHHRITFDGTPVGEGFTTGRGFFDAFGFVGFPSAGTRKVGLGVSLDGLPAGTKGDQLLPRDVALEYDRLFVPIADQLEFTSTSSDARVDISGFTNGAVTLLDLSAPLAPKAVTNVAVSGSGPFTASFPQDPAGPRPLLAFASGAGRGKADVTVRAVNRADLRNTANRAGWLAIAPSGWTASLATLVARRQAQGLEPMVVDVEDVADEFGGGVLHPQAIKDLLAYARANWARSPTYVVLASDTHNNPRLYPGSGSLFATAQPVGVPTYLEVAGAPGQDGHSSFQAEGPSDGWYGDLVGDDRIFEVAIGRLPATDAAELATMAQKIVSYEAQPATTWSRQILAVADDNEPLFTQLSDQALSALLPGLEVQKYHQGDTATFPNLATYKTQLHAAFDAGALLVQYVGHAFYPGWTADNVLTNGDLTASSNGTKQPFVLSLTCYDGNFTLIPEFSLPSMSETALRASGGAIAYYGSGVQSTIQAKDLLHRAFLDALFVQDNRRIGDALRVASATVKANSSDPEKTLVSFNLMGDPATTLGVPNPRRPVNVRAVQASQGRVLLQWDPVPGATSYQIFRRRGSGAAVLVATVTTTSFEEAIPGTTPGALTTTTFYSVRAVNGALGSSTSAETSFSITSNPASSGGGGGGGGGCAASSAPASAALPLLAMLLPFGLRRRPANRTRRP